MLNKYTIALKKTAYFAGGCFWCVEAVFQRVKGVEAVVSGYMGGTIKNPAYREVCTGRTGHTEAVKVTYDPSEVTYELLVAIFFSTHDPTTLNRQGNDTGTQYRSGIYYTEVEQKEVIQLVIKQLTDENVFEDNIVTEIKEASPFYDAEKGHHSYYNRNKEQAYCTYTISPKMDKIKNYFSNYLNESYER